MIGDFLVVKKNKIDWSVYIKQADIPIFQYDWSKSVYGELQEIKPGKSITEILLSANKTPLDWNSKKQQTVETATYGSEFVVTYTCAKQIIDILTILCFLERYTKVTKSCKKINDLFNTSMCNYKLRSIDSCLNSWLLFGVPI